MHPHIHNHSPVALVMVDDFEYILAKVLTPGNRPLLAPITQSGKERLLVFFSRTSAKQSVAKNAPSTILISSMRASPRQRVVMLFLEAEKETEAKRTDGLHTARESARIALNNAESGIVQAHSEMLKVDVHERVNKDGQKLDVHPEELSSLNTGRPQWVARITLRWRTLFRGRSYFGVRSLGLRHSFRSYRHWPHFRRWLLDTTLFSRRILLLLLRLRCEHFRWMFR